MSELNGSFGQADGLVGTLGTDKSLDGYLGAVGSLTGELGGSLIPGPQGPKGEKGEKGDKGDKGDTGPQGPRGEIGETGPAGETGAVGAQGPVGPKGDTGAKGDTGERGETGPKGDTGEPGPKGDTGPAGPKGDKGDTGERGETGATGPMGPQGDRGPKGDRGDTGVSGKDGADGISPTVSIIAIPGGHRITITDADGQHSADVMDGDDYVLTAQDKSDIAGLVDVPVDDVQVNGTSIVSNGVAEIPIATSRIYGVAKPSNHGVQTNATGQYITKKASSAEIKLGAENYNIISPINQHESAFYGLAKAAGDTTQSASSNAIGTYTDEAIVAIQKMLGVYQAPWELINDYTVPEDSETVEVITDLSGQPFELTESFIRVYFQPSLTGTNDYIKGNSYARKTNDAIGFIGFPTVKYMANGTATYSEYKQEIIEDVLRTEVRTGGGAPNTQNVQSSSSAETVVSIMGLQLRQYNTTSTLIPQGTHILVYGRRKI